MILLHRIRAHPGLSGFVIAYTVALGALSAWQENLEFVFYALAMPVYIGLVLLVDARVRFSELTLWALAVWGGLHMAGGTVPIPTSLADGDKDVLYALRIAGWLPRYDQVVHAFGFFAATLACAEVLLFAVKRERLTIGLAFGAALMGMGLGALNEVVEFAIAMNVEGHGVGGYVNTGWDLVSNTIGAVTAAGLLWGMGTGQKRVLESRKPPEGRNG